ncbi:MAG: dihydrodipicolinate synthase family protein [Acidobacteria bacterium]|nr:dihydrodipicolinate synthase family protein [Acidobacteriota bacterium]
MPLPVLDRIDGIVPIIPTPFTPDEQVDWASLGDLIEFAIAAGARAVCLPAYASEFYKLSEEERCQIAAEAVRQSAGRIPVIAQVNHPSARHAARFAICAQKSGAAAVCVAVPRLFPLGDDDLVRYFDSILQALDIPLVIQDFNPGGPTLSPGFIATLHRAHPHFRFVKLEEQMMASKVMAIVQQTGGGVGVLEGWGGMYMLELVPAGICGVMPSLGLADVLDLVFRLLSGGSKEEAAKVFEGVLPQIVFSLQNMELYHHAEKRLLQARGVLQDSSVREASLQLKAHDEQHIHFLNRRILRLLDRLDLPHDPAAGAGSRATGAPLATTSLPLRNT